jgi:hypothetical protein
VDAGRPNPAQWLWYAFGGGLPRSLSPWVLADTTARTWVWRHLARALVQLTPVVVLCLLLPPVDFGIRLTAAGGGLVIGLLFSVAYMTETTEHRAVKAGWPPGTTAERREQRAERERVERRARYRSGGSGSFD